MPTFTVSKDQFDVLKVALNLTYGWLENRAGAHREAGEEVPPVLGRDIAQYAEVQGVLARAENVGTFDAGVALGVLERADIRTGSTPAFFLWSAGGGSQEQVEHAIRLYTFGMLTGHLDRNHGVHASGLTEHGTVLRDLLRAWSAAPPLRKPQRG